VTDSIAFQHPSASVFHSLAHIMSLVDDKEYEQAVAAVAEAKRLYGCRVSDMELAQPLDIASSAQRDLLARKLADDPRFKFVHDAVHFGRALSCASDPSTCSKGLALSRQTAVIEFYNSDEWRAAADARFNPAAPVRKGMCTFCPDKPAAVLLSQAPGDTSCCSCAKPMTHAYLERNTKKRPVPLCCERCPRAPWAVEVESDADYTSDSDDYKEMRLQVRRKVLHAEITERNYKACFCGFERDSEDVKLSRLE
jgi:hypothetical protein